MNEKQAKVHAALSAHVFTPAYEFVPRMLESNIDRKEIHETLVELQAMGLAELAYGQGWRAIPDETMRINETDQAIYKHWQRHVADGSTILGYPEWVAQQAIAAGMFDEEEGK